MQSLSKKKLPGKKSLQDHEDMNSNMRTESRGLSHANPTSSRPDLLTNSKTMTAEQRHDAKGIVFIEREFSHEDILESKESGGKRQVVGLLTKDRADPISSMQIVASREELERTAMSAKRSSNLDMYKLDDLHSKLQHLDSGMGGKDAEQALRDNPSRLQGLHEIQMDAKKHLAELVGLKNQQGPDKNRHIAAVAQK